VQQVAGRQARVEAGHEGAHLAHAAALLPHQLLDAQHLLDLGPARLREVGRKCHGHPQHALLGATAMTPSGPGDGKDFAGWGWSKSNAMSAARSRWLDFTAKRRWPTGRSGGDRRRTQLPACHLHPDPPGARAPSPRCGALLGPLLRREGNASAKSQSR
jgi:hypothetical protein